MGSGKDRSWDYGSMKVDVADFLTCEDCQRAGQLIGLKPAVLEKVKGGRELLMELEKRGKLSCDYVQFLKELLEKLEISQAIKPIEDYEQLVNKRQQATAESADVNQRVAGSKDSKEQPDYTKSHMGTLVSESKLSELSENLGEDWKSFCRQKLKLKGTEITNCEYGRTHLPDIVCECLLKWRESFGLEATYGELAKMLYEFGFSKEVWGLLETPDQ